MVADSSAIPFLIWRLRRDAVPPGVGQTRIQTVYSMGEALDRLEQLTAERARAKTLFGRVKSAIGLCQLRQASHASPNAAIPASPSFTSKS